MIDISVIREHMPVLDARGNRVGTVECLFGRNEIRLSRTNSPDGLCHYIPLDWIATVDRSVHLRKSAADVMRARG